MPSLPAGTFPSTYDNNQRTSFEKNSGTGYLTTTAGVSPGGSSLFDGTGDYLTISNSQNFYNLGTADWTIEFWVYISDLPDHRGVFQIGEDVGALCAMIYTDGKIKLIENDQAVVFESNSSLSINTWYHIAFTNDDSSNTQRLYINGIAQSNTGSKSTAYSYSNKTVYIGGRYYSGSFQKPFKGYISNFRVVGGSVVYPPASGGGSAYFDGAGDYTLTATNSNLVIGTNNFAAECWIYPTTFATVSNVIDRRRSGDTASYDWTTYLTTSGEYAFYADGSTRITSSALTVNKWYHTAVVRNINTGDTTLYIDGVSQGTYADTNNYPSNQMTFGIYGPGLPSSLSLPYTGYLSNFRLIIGTAANNGVEYGSNFTPPTSPLTTTAHTEFMTFQNYTGSINDESTNGITITAGGNVTASYSSPFIESKSPLTAITNTQLLTCQNITGSISDASSNGYTITANGDVTGDSSSPFASTFSSTTVASLRLLGFDSAGSIHRFNNGGTIYNRLSNGLLVKVATRDSQSGFAINPGDSNVAGAGEITPLIAFDSANSVERYTQGTLYHEQVPAPGNNPGILVKMLTRDSLGGGNAATQSAGTAYAMNIGDSSIGNVVGAAARLLKEDSANGVGTYNTGTIYGDVQKTALNTILGTRVPRTNFKGNIGVMADSSGGGVGGVSGGGQITYTEILLNF